MTMSASRLPRRLVPVVVAALVLGACATDDDPGTGATSETSTTAPSEPADVAEETTGGGTSDDSMSDHATSDDTTTEEATTEEATTEDGSTEAAESAAPDVTATLADGSTVTLADYAGEQVFVETFATWCSNCRRQLGDTATAASTASDDATFLALSVETELDPSELETYAQDNGFEDVTFGVLDAASLATLNDTFGNAVLVPPSTPKFVVAEDGSVSDLTTGFESVDEILAQVGDGA